MNKERVNITGLYGDVIRAGLDDLFNSRPHNQRFPEINATDWCAVCTKRFESSLSCGAMGGVVVDGYRFISAICTPCNEKPFDPKLVERNLLRSLRLTLLDENVGVMDSPLEIQVFDYLIEKRNARPIADKDVRGLLLKFDGLEIACIPQFTVPLSKNFRLDFLFMSKEVPGLMVAVEIDGHDFHERTKEQAQKDKSRDRLLTQAGYTVFRYTGSEIFRNTDKCIREVLCFIAGKANGALP